MEREKPTFDILGRIERERLSRGWSEYALAENSGLTQSTISTWRRRNLQPNVASLEKICSGLGISLSQFFQEEDSVYLTSDQKELLDLWAKLSPAQRTAVSQMLRSFLYKGNGINFSAREPLVSKANFREHPLTAHPFSEWVCYRGACKNSLSTRASHSRTMFL